MINVKRKEGSILRITRVLEEPSRDSLELYLYVPDELGLTTDVISEDALYHSALHGKRFYFSAEHQLPLVRSQLDGQGQLDNDRYRLNLSLYAFQFVTAQEQTTRDLVERFRDEEENNDASPEELAQHLDIIESILRRLRRNEPGDQRRNKYFINIDNYTSWFTQQEILALLAELPSKPAYAAVRERMLSLCEREERYREDKQYNSQRVRESATRMSNKMRLLRRLIEFPITLKDKPKELGGGEKRLVKALVTGLVMMVISGLVLELRVYFVNITIWFFLALAVLYAVREVFKEDLRQTLWRWVRKGRPKWRKRYRDPDTNAVVGVQREWFEIIKPRKVAPIINDARHSNVSQRGETVLHYRSSARMLPTRFLSGYSQTREILTLDLNVLRNLMEPGNHRVYTLKEGNVDLRQVERRYQFNLIARSQQGAYPADIQRFKIVMNRSRILDVEEIVRDENGQRRAEGALQPANELSERTS